MEFDNQASNSNASSPGVYMTAPTTPEEYTANTTMYYYYSAPASPRRRPAGCAGANLDAFEFETSKRLSGQVDSGTSESSVEDDGVRYRRGDSLPAMAFADELFLNGLVMPLRLPPRLQSESDYDSFSWKSPVSSPRTVCRIPFARKSSWNDDFDPFMVALEKVREEKRGRNSHHRRSRSYSPFRADCSNQSFTSSPTEAMQGPPANYSGPLDFKGSAYARWVRDQTRHGLSPKSPRWFFPRQITRPLKMEPGETGKPVSPKGKNEGSRVQKLKGFLMRYASFGRDDSGSKKTKTKTKTRPEAARKAGYFGRMSFKFKGNGKRKMAPDTTMAVVQYNPPIAHCLGYGVRTPIQVK